ncbi:MAG: sulfatase [Bacteroidales bacterium]
MLLFIRLKRLVLYMPAIVSFAILGCSRDQGPAKVPDQPNIVFFVLDDLNDWINPLGYHQAITPNLDRLAESGVMFTNAHAPGVYCAPSRTAIFSGLQATTTGCYQNEVFFYDYRELVSLQMAFQQGGYNTWGAGKIFHHRGGYVDLRGWNEFFARSEEIRESGYETGSWGSDVPLPDPYPYSPYYRNTDKEFKGAPFLEWGPIADSLEDKMIAVQRTRWVCDLLQQPHEKPFFIALGLYTPHFPNYAPQKYFDMYDLSQIQVPYLKKDDLDDLPEGIRKRMINRRRMHQETLESIDAVKEAVRAYLAAVTYADAMLGRILDALEENGHSENTIVIMWSDHGYHHGEKGQWGKHTLWRQTTRVPLIFSGANLPENKRINATVGLIDLYPTLIELCNLPGQHAMDGVSLLPFLRDPESATDRNLFIPSHERESYTVVNENWRYIYYKDGTEELYNIREDQDEWYNLAEDEIYRPVIDGLKQTVPAEFHPGATPMNKLKLVIEGDGFYWEPK